MKSNVLYLHSHATGRYVQPYGHPVPTSNIQHLADQGVLFRQAFAAAPVCSGSRAALLTGQCSHASGMLGLAHRGFRLAHPERHIVNVLRQGGYWTGSWVSSMSRPTRTTSGTTTWPTSLPPGSVTSLLRPPV